MNIRAYFSLFILLFFLGCQPANETPTEKLKRKADEFYDKGFYKQAMPYFSSLIENDSTQGEFFFKRGYCTAWMNKYPAAIQDFQHSIRLNYKKETSYINIGVLYSNFNDSLAEYYFEKCLAENPKNEKALDLLEGLRERSSKKVNRVF